MSKEITYCADCENYEKDESGYGLCKLGEYVCKDDDYCRKAKKKDGDNK